MADVLDPALGALVSPWAFHWDLLQPGSAAVSLPWEDDVIPVGDVKSESGQGLSDNVISAQNGDEAGPGMPSECATTLPKGTNDRRRERKKERKAEKHAGVSGAALTRGFLNRGGADAKAPALMAPATPADEASSVSMASGTRKKKLPPGHYWVTRPQCYTFKDERQIKVEQWSGIEQFGEIEKPGKVDSCKFFRLAAIADPADIKAVLAHCKQSKAYGIDADSVDKTPTFEYYPFRDGAWQDAVMQQLLEGFIEQRLLPYIRERYDCRFCALADILVRRYVPGERRSHAVHFDGHAFVTAVLGLSCHEDYAGGLYLQPKPDVSSRLFFKIEPGDLVVHGFDLQHGVHVWKGVRYSLIFWIKNSLQAVRDRSTPWYDKLAENNDPDALYNIAQNYEYGTFGKPLDLNKSIALYERSAQAGHHFAQNNLGLIYRRVAEKSGIPNAISKSFEWLKVAAESGFAMAQKNLAIAYANGHGVRADNVQAAVWMRRAAEQLEVEAAYLMAEMYRQGRGVPLDSAEAAKWYERGAEAGFPKAQYSLGMVYLEGAGVEKDPRISEVWLRFAARQGNPEAKNNLATIHAQRGEVNLAADIWAELAQQGEQNAQCNIGMCFMRGAGRDKDLSEAQRWLKKAAKQGHQMAAEALMQLGSVAS